MGGGGRGADSVKCVGWFGDWSKVRALSLAPTRDSGQVSLMRAEEREFQKKLRVGNSRKGERGAGGGLGLKRLGSSSLM